MIVKIETQSSNYNNTNAIFPVMVRGVEPPYPNWQ